jgi:hypothetical protein
MVREIEQSLGTPSGDAKKALEALKAEVNKADPNARAIRDLAPGALLGAGTEADPSGEGVAGRAASGDPADQPGLRSSRSAAHSSHRYASTPI